MSTWFFRPGAMLMTWLLWAFGPGRVEGLENVPREGAFIVVANHCSNLDPPFLGAVIGRYLGRVVHFMAKAEMRRWLLIGWLASQSGVFFVRRGEGDRGAYRSALTHLAAGEIIALFPEGTRSRDGELKEGRSGAALLAVRSGVPILPAGIAGTHRIFARRSRLPHRSRVTIRIGQAFRLPEIRNGQLERGLLETGTDRIMREIAALVPPEQRGRWGSQSRSG
jgi:1-acyl-sn-glycerol-3-phosphate acyltransferase